MSPSRGREGCPELEHGPIPPVESPTLAAVVTKHLGVRVLLTRPGLAPLASITSNPASASASRLHQHFRSPGNWGEGEANARATRERRDCRTRCIGIRGL